MTLLPTPMVSDTQAKGPADLTRNSPQLRAVERLLPAPAANTTHDQWGAYAAAVTRWEAVTGRTAPTATEPGTKGQPRLSATFVEWLMGLEPGHVTNIPSVGRNAQLKALGNGVVPQQAALAVAAILPDVPASILDRLRATDSPHHSE